LFLVKNLLLILFVFSMPVNIVVVNQQHLIGLQNK
jgi:hypothetical protein